MAEVPMVTSNTYLEGNFAPVTEEVTVTDLQVTGSLPEHLDGRYLRNGPNPLGTPDPASYHWFIGDGMVHGLRLRGGRAEWYRNRWVRSGPVTRRLGEAPRQGAPHPGIDFAANTSVVTHAGRIMALVEGGATPYELTDELGTVGPYDFDGTLRGGYSAHPLTDPATGELHAVSYFWAWGNRVRYSVVTPEGRVRREVDIEVGASPMMHAFSLTERYVCIYDLPVVFDPVMAAASTPAAVRPVSRAFLRQLAKGRVRIPSSLALRLASGSASAAGSGSGGLFPYRWDDRHPARVGLLPREAPASAIRWFDVEPCYVFHPVNAYDTDAGVVIDVARHGRVFERSLLGPDEAVPTLDRWTVDLAAGKVVEERLDDRPQEFPRIDERWTGRRTRWSWTVASSGSGAPGTFDSLSRWDDAAGAAQVHTFGAGRSADEFSFVPSPGGAEGDGVVMGFVHDAVTDRSSLEVFDASSLEPVATVSLPVRVPHGFHGTWVPAA